MQEVPTTPSLSKVHRARCARPGARMCVSPFNVTTRSLQHAHNTRRRRGRWKRSHHNITARPSCFQTRFDGLKDRCASSPRIVIATDQTSDIFYLLLVFPSLFISSSQKVMARSRRPSLEVIRCEPGRRSDDVDRVKQRQTLQLAARTTARAFDPVKLALQRHLCQFASVGRAGLTESNVHASTLA